MITPTVPPSGLALGPPALSGFDLPLPPTLTVRQTSRLFGIGLRQTYEAIHADEIPSVRIGRRLLVPTYRVLAMFGLPADQLLGLDQPPPS